MDNFDLDNYKKSWQEQNSTTIYDDIAIKNMLNKKSKNFVKYIFWISLAEFLLFLFANILSLFSSDNSSFLNIVKKIGIEVTANVSTNFNLLYLFFKVSSLLVTAVFLWIFFKNYKSIKIEENLKQVIAKIVQFKKNVRVFIFMNIILLLIFILEFSIFCLYYFKLQQLEINSNTLSLVITGTLISMSIALVLMLLYYKLIYGILMQKLTKTLEQLKEMNAS